jgi:hypothetical protein
MLKAGADVGDGLKAEASSRSAQIVSKDRYSLKVYPIQSLMHRNDVVPAIFQVRRGAFRQSLGGPLGPAGRGTVGLR